MRALYTLIIALIVILFAGPTCSKAEARWIEGDLQTSYIYSCVSVILGNATLVVGTYSITGVYLDPANPPKVGETFYAHIVVAGIGDTCSLKYAVAPEIILPSGVSVVKNPATPIQCTLKDSQSGTSVDYEGCPANVVPGVWGTNSVGVYPGADSQDGWVVPQGAILIITVPLVSSRELRATDINDNLRTAIKIVDSNSNPILNPQVSLLVSPAPVTEVPPVIIPEPTPTPVPPTVTPPVVVPPTTPDAPTPTPIPPEVVPEPTPVIDEPPTNPSDPSPTLIPPSVDPVDPPTNTLQPTPTPTITADVQIDETPALETPTPTPVPPSVVINNPQVWPTPVRIAAPTLKVRALPKAISRKALEKGIRFYVESDRWTTTTTTITANGKRLLRVSNPTRTSRVAFAVTRRASQKMGALRIEIEVFSTSGKTRRALRTVRLMW